MGYLQDGGLHLVAETGDDLRCRITKSLSRQSKDGGEYVRVVTRGDRTI
jgi:hypothetical protein